MTLMYVMPMWRSDSAEQKMTKCHVLREEALPQGRARKMIDVCYAHVAQW